MESVKRGSLTVEAVLLSPILLFVLFLLLYLLIYIHHRVWLSQAACEAAITGCMEEDQKKNGERRAQIKAKELSDSLFYPVKDLNWKIEEDRWLTVTYEGEFQVLFPKMSWKLQETGQAKVLDPPSYIRKTHSRKQES